MIVVRAYASPNSFDKYENGVRFAVHSDSQLLSVYDKANNEIALYAHGHWASVVVEPKKD